jgi:hypothetical protein
MPELVEVEIISKIGFETYQMATVTVEIDGDLAELVAAFRAVADNIEKEASL